MPEGHNLQPLSWRLWGGGCHPQRHNFQTLQSRWTKLPYQNVGRKYLGKWWELGGGDSSSDDFRLLKKAIALWISNRMGPFWSFYNNAFYKNLICPPGINNKFSPEGCGGRGVILEHIMSRPFDYIQQNGCIKMLIGSVWGNHGCRGGGHSPSDHFLLLIKTLAL